MRTTTTTVIIACTLFGGVLAAACGSEDTNVDDPANQDGGSSGSSGFTGDGAAEGSTGPSACGDTSADPKNCGKCGAVCAADKQCAGGACACATYTADCGGGCKQVVNDANNCGACGKTCVAPQVCTGGGCADTCLPGTTICGGACFDQKNDNDNCGACGTKCGAGKGCVAGVCRDAATLGTGPTNCAGGGPPISIGAGAVGDPCSGSLATKTFTWALCSCKNIQFSGYALVDGFDSTKGPYKPGELGAGMGYNDGLQTSSSFDIWGTMWGGGTAGFQTNSAATVKFDLRSNGAIKTTAPTFPVSENAYVNGNVEGKFTIGKKLHVPAGATVNEATAAGGVVQAPVSVPPPCACQPKDILPIAAIVDARATKNDNATLGLTPALLNQPATQTRVDLPCGSYYLSNIQNGNAVTIVTHGKTALYIGGDVINAAPLSILPAPGSELDIVIKGIIKAGADLQLGAPSYPAATRVYVGGTGEILLASDTLLGSNLYAPNANVAWSSATAAFGAVFAGDFKSNSVFKIHYDRAIVGTVKNCPGPAGSGDGGSSSGGPTGCGSCRDCNNQACVGGKCGDCTDSSQCCAPLVCMGGTCGSPIN